jgi:NADH-quinone oxidoreductase subunit C
MSDVREPSTALEAKDAGQQPEAQPHPAASGVPNEVFEQRRGMFGVRNGADTTGYSGLVRRVQLPGSTARPYGGEFDEIADALELAYPQLGEALERVVVDRGELTFVVRRTHLLQVMQVLRDDPALRFEFCAGVAGIHYPEDTGRELHAVWPLLSITHNRRVRVETTAPDADPHVPSVVRIYPGDDWHERETWDLMGLVFDGHPALTRILMPDDWPGHPQRKDYPLGGIPVEYHGAQIPPPDERRSYSG